MRLLSTRVMAASALLALTGLVASACFSNATPRATNNTTLRPNTVAVQELPTVALPTATAPLPSSAELPVEDADNVRQAAAEFFGEGAPDDIELEGIRPLGASSCFVLRANLNRSRFPPNFVVLPDGQISGPDENAVNQILTPCFYDVGLQPTADDVARVAITKAPFLIGLRMVTELPAEVVDGLSPVMIEETPMDFATYTGPVLVDVDGSPTSLFVAIDNIGAYHLVRTIAVPLEARLDSITLIYVG